MGGFDESLPRISIGCARLLHRPPQRPAAVQGDDRLPETAAGAAAPPHYAEYSRYYQAQALFQGDVEAWEKWNKMIIRQFKQTQQADGSFKGQHGPSICHVDVASGAGPQLPFPADLRALMTTIIRSSMFVVRCSTFLMRSATILWATLAVSLTCGAELSKPAAATVLHLTNGGYVAGELKNSGGPSRLGWQSPLFAAPFDFDVNLVNAVHFPLPASCPMPSASIASSCRRETCCSGHWRAGQGRYSISTFRRSAACTSRQSDLLRFSRLARQRRPGVPGPERHGRLAVACRSTGLERRIRPPGDEPGRRLAAQPFRASRAGGRRVRNLVEEKAGLHPGPGGRRRRKAVPAGLAVRGLGRRPGGPPRNRRRQRPGARCKRSRPDRAAPISQVYLDQNEGQLPRLFLGGQKTRRLETNREPLPVSPGGVRLDNKHGDLRLERLRIARWAGGSSPRSSRPTNPASIAPTGRSSMDASPGSTPPRASFWSARKSRGTSRCRRHRSGVMPVGRRCRATGGPRQLSGRHPGERGARQSRRMGGVARRARNQGTIAAADRRVAVADRPAAPGDRQRRADAGPTRDARSRWPPASRPTGR